MIHRYIKVYRIADLDIWLIPKKKYSHTLKHVVSGTDNKIKSVLRKSAGSTMLLRVYCIAVRTSIITLN